MAIFVTNMLQISDIKQAIMADLNFTHTNPLVQDACLIYGSCVHYLLNYVTDPLRAQKSFDQALKLSQSYSAGSIDSKSGESCQAWIKEAKAMIELRE